MKWARWVRWLSPSFTGYGCPEGALCLARGERAHAGLRQETAGSRLPDKAPEQGPTLEKGTGLRTKACRLTCLRPTLQPTKWSPRPPLTATPSSSAPQARTAQPNQTCPAACRASPQTRTRRPPILNHGRKRKSRRSGAPPRDSPGATWDM